VIPIESRECSSPPAGACPNDATGSQTEPGLRHQVGEWLGAFPPGEPVVVVPVFNACEDVVKCVESLLANTPPGVPILVLDDASTDARVPAALEKFSIDKRFKFGRKLTNSGFVDTVNLAFAWCAPRDVVVVNSDVVVPPAWLERLRAAAYYRSTVATVTPFTNHGTIVSVPYRNRPTNELVGGSTVEEVDALVRQSSLRLYPILPTAVGHCIYFKRTALDAVGYFDAAFSPGYGEEVDFSQRAILAGFSNVLADDLFVYHKGASSFGSQGRDFKRRIQTEHHKLIYKRYPWYVAWVRRVEADAQGTLAWAIERAQLALLGCRIAVDATCLSKAYTGTQIGTLELIRALATNPGLKAHMSVIIRDGVPRDALLGVDQLVDEIVLLSDLQDAKEARFDLVHRPFQVRSVKELVFLKKIARRLIISQLDFIAFSNPSYAAHPQNWEQYRRLTRLALDIADGVVLNSQDVAKDAVQQGTYVDDQRFRVVSPGVDHLLDSGPAAATEEVSDRLPQPPFILMLGTDFRHKNRLYALALVQVLVRKHGWNGKLVFAGPHAAWGGSADDEASLLARNPDLKNYLSTLGVVSQAEKRWLLENASLVLYPSTYEGFGLVPFEAAAAGTPPLATRAASLGEVLGDDVISLDSFNPEQGADVVWSLISDPDLAARQLSAVQARMSTFTWAAAATKTWDFYEQILSQPPRVWAGSMGQPLDRELREMLLFGGKSVSAWRRRLAWASYVGLVEGIGSLYREIRQYIHWLIHPGR